MRSMATAWYCPGHPHDKIGSWCPILRPTGSAASRERHPRTKGWKKHYWRALPLGILETEPRTPFVRRVRSLGTREERWLDSCGTIAATECRAGRANSQRSRLMVWSAGVQHLASRSFVTCLSRAVAKAPASIVLSPSYGAGKTCGSRWTRAACNSPAPLPIRALSPASPVFTASSGTGSKVCRPAQTRANRTSPNSRNPSPEAPGT
jgi:hypothetical protein